MGKDNYSMEEFEELQGCINCMFFVNPFRAENKNMNRFYWQCFGCYNRWSKEFKNFRYQGYILPPRPTPLTSDAEFQKECDQATGMGTTLSIEEIRAALREPQDD